MQDGIQGDRKHIKVYSTLRSEKLSNFVFGMLECWEVSFNAIEEPRSGKPCASCMWFERKRQVFDGIKCPAYVVNELILQTLFDWMYALGSTPSIALVNFIDSLSF